MEDTCEICSKVSKALLTCERCYKEICEDCCCEGYPYDVVLCSECFEEWQKLMKDNDFHY